MRFNWGEQNEYIYHNVYDLQRFLEPISPKFLNNFCHKFTEGRYFNRSKSVKNHTMRRTYPFFSFSFGFHNKKKEKKIVSPSRTSDLFLRNLGGVHGHYDAKHATTGASEKSSYDQKGEHGNTDYDENPAEDEGRNQREHQPLSTDLVDQEWHNWQPAGRTQWENRGDQGDRGYVVHVLFFQKFNAWRAPSDTATQ